MLPSNNNSGSDLLSTSNSSTSGLFLQQQQQQTEKPEHYRYLKEFRVEQCPLFPQHKCLLHRPFTCFHWHFPNQRRRRPVRRRDGTFNYNPDNYCSKYDEGAGVCPDGDECPLLHRTAGDTERRYHLRYYKTCMCVYETDGKGCCLKNGLHCAFAHGEGDRRPPVFDAREVQQTDSDLIEGGLSSSFNAALHFQQQQQNTIGSPTTGNEKLLILDDCRWQDASYVLVFYKTEGCRRPPRLCRQGYACPHYHNQRDRRRSPQYYKYRSTPCPNVKHGDEWGEPGGCEEGDDCSYCHTRTEQQFHPEIYKSSKCHDVFTSNYCPRGPFCAFAHIESEMALNRSFPLDKSCLSELVNINQPVVSMATPAIQSSDPIDIYKPTNYTPYSQPQQQNLSYSSAVGGGSKLNNNDKIGSSYLNGILTYEENLKRRRGEEGGAESSDCYWLFPSTTTASNTSMATTNNESTGGLSPTTTALLTENTLLLLEDDDDYFKSSKLDEFLPGQQELPNLFPPPPSQQQQQLLNQDGSLKSDWIYASWSSIKEGYGKMKESLSQLEEIIKQHQQHVQQGGQLHRGASFMGCLCCKDAYRCTVLLPCQHQVACNNCQPNVCPLCQETVRGRRVDSLLLLGKLNGG